LSSNILLPIGYILYLAQTLTSLFLDVEGKRSLPSRRSSKIKEEMIVTLKTYIFNLFIVYIIYLYYYYYIILYYLLSIVLLICLSNYYLFIICLSNVLRINVR